jgi:hypothetical protein
MIVGNDRFKGPNLTPKTPSIDALSSASGELDNPQNAGYNCRELK